MSKPISRVLSWTIISLRLLSPASSSNLPRSTAGSRIASCTVLLRMGFTCALFVTKEAVSSYLAFPPLPNHIDLAVYLCCTFLEVASTRRYLASCPMELGLSSPKAFRLSRCDRLAYSLLELLYHNTVAFVYL